MNNQPEKADYQTRLKQYNRRQNIAGAIAIILSIVLLIGIVGVLITILGLDGFLVFVVVIGGATLLVAILNICSRWLNEEPPKE